MNTDRWLGIWIARQPIRELACELDKLTVAMTVSASRFEQMTAIIEPLTRLNGWEQVAPIENARNVNR